MEETYIAKAGRFEQKVNSCNEELGEILIDIELILNNFKIDLEVEDALAVYTNNSIEQIKLNVEKIIKNNQVDVKEVKNEAINLDSQKEKEEKEEKE